MRWSARIGRKSVFLALEPEWRNLKEPDIGTGPKKADPGGWHRRTDAGQRDPFTPAVPSRRARPVQEVWEVYAGSCGTFGSTRSSSVRTCPQSLFVMRSDGSSLRQLTRTAVSERRPAWSPDGRLLVFVRFNRTMGSSSLWILDLASGRERQLTAQGPWVDDSPSWSSRGLIAFVRRRPVSFTDSDSVIELVPASGPTQVPIGQASEGLSSFSFLSWSPDGNRLAFTANLGANVDIFVEASNGTGLTRLTDSASPDTSPTWSPDGKYIAFASYRDTGVRGAIYAMREDGSGQVRLTAPLGDGIPSWGPAPAKV